MNNQLRVVELWQDREQVLVIIAPVESVAVISFVAVSRERQNGDVKLVLLKNLQLLLGFILVRSLEVSDGVAVLALVTQDEVRGDSFGTNLVAKSVQRSVNLVLIHIDLATTLASKDRASGLRTDHEVMLTLGRVKWKGLAVLQKNH